MNLLNWKKYADEFSVIPGYQQELTVQKKSGDVEAAKGIEQKIKHANSAAGSSHQSSIKM
jgi:hypothetical protein